MKVNLLIKKFGEVTGSDAIGSVFVKLLSVFTDFYLKQCSEKKVYNPKKIEIYNHINLLN